MLNLIEWGAKVQPHFRSGSRGSESSRERKFRYYLNSIIVASLKHCLRCRPITAARKCLRYASKQTVFFDVENEPVRARCTAIAGRSVLYCLPCRLLSTVNRCAGSFKSCCYSFSQRSLFSDDLYWVDWLILI